MRIANPLSHRRRERSHPPVLRALGALLLVALLGGCGEPLPPGGHGHLEHREGAPDLLTLEGSPREMGWWQGRLLRSRLLALHERWQQALEAELIGAGGEGTARQALKHALDQHGDLCLDQTQMRLSEQSLQELDGMAEATGLKPEQILRLDVLRDALRMKGLSARLPGAVGVARAPDGYEARGWWSGPDAALLAAEAIVIHRKPADGVESVAVSWPGSLGALAALTAQGLGFVAADAEVRDKRRIGFGGGRPFFVAAHEALGESDRAAGLMAAVTGTMGHVFVAFSLDRQSSGHPLSALAAFEVYFAAEPPAVLDRLDLLGIGPHEIEGEGPAAALDAALRNPASTLEERWLQLRASADSSGAGAIGPQVSIRWTGTQGELTFRVRQGGGARTVRLP